MMFFVIPEGIAQFPFWVSIFGVLFFVLLLMAGLTSAVSLVETLVSSIIDAFDLPRRTVVMAVAILGMVGSVAFALPQVIDPALDSDGALGLTLLDLADHWSFSYGLLLGGLIECVFLGWFFPTDKLLAHINEHSSIHLGAWFKWLIRVGLPAMILLVLGSGLHDEITRGVYGHDFKTGPYRGIHLVVLVGWFVYSIGLAAIFMWLRNRREAKGGI